jgi:uncharacterized protein YuzE
MTAKTCYTCASTRRAQEVINRRVRDDAVLDMSEDDRIVGIEILDASERLNLSELLPIQYRQPREVHRCGH